MDATLLILLVLLAIASIAAFWKGRWPLVWEGLKITGRTLRLMWFRILLGMALGGFIQVLVPDTSIAEWLGPASGLKGILIGSYIGLFMGGGPFVVLPILASIYKAGAGAGPVVALMSGGLLSVQGLVTWYIPLLGVRLSLSKYIICLFVPPIVGLIAGALAQLFNVV